ncbi:MAG: FAD:protein FMN transferase [candidate division WOR-3 bacterium]|nr:MAG: FAD:protein FMN transferase [candidate division WOR-3 bacterium]
MTVNTLRAALFACIIMLLVLACGVPQKEYSYSNFLFGAPCNITFYFIGEERAREIIEVIDLELTRLDSLLNYFSEKSLVSELNRRGRVQATSDIVFLFALSDSVSRLTDGIFDISVAPFLEAWGFYEGKKMLPSPEELDRIRSLVDYRRIRITSDSIIIEPGMRVDLGGIAQGFAADRAADILRQNHVKSAIIDIGGEVLAIGKSPEKRAWRVGIRNPRGKGIVEAVDLQDSAVSTSGDYEKYIVIEGQRYPHIINPKTGMPAREFASVTIFARDAAFADAMSTATAVMGAKRGIEFLDSLGLKGIIYYEWNNAMERVTSE